MRKVDEAAAGREHGKHGAVCGVLGEQRRGRGAAIAHRYGRFARNHGLAAQDSVLVDEREAD
jgi:hypothetical protein